MTTEDDIIAPLLPQGGDDKGIGEKSRTPLTTVCPFILGNELCERLAYYGLSTNLVVYFHQVLDMSTAEANTQVNIWAGTCYVTPILGAIVADSYLGRYRTIMVFSTIYLVRLNSHETTRQPGSLTLSLKHKLSLSLSLCVCVSQVGLLLLAGTNVAVDRTNLSYLQVSYMLFIALYTIAVGTGGIKPNVSSFGADQFDEDDPDHVRDKKSFFNWFYMFINLGSLMASTVVVYIQQEVSWTIGFVIPAACM